MKREPDMCRRWPACICKEHWDFYDQAPVEYLEHAQLIIEAMLACISEHCPDRRYRQHATVQILKIQSSSKGQKCASF
jgi:hypothetical protein